MSLFFHFKNLSEKDIELFDAMILSGVIDDLQIDINRIDSCAIVDEGRVDEFKQFLNTNGIHAIKALTEDFREIVEPELQEFDLKKDRLK